MIKQVEVDGATYEVDLYRKVTEGESAPRLLVVSYQPTKQAQEILKRCIQSIQRFTTEPYELWVIDNNSPKEYRQWLIDWPDINVVLSENEPVPPAMRGFFRRLVATLRNRYGQQHWGSYANALALEIAARLIEPETHYLVTLHMDTIVCHPDWLAILRQQLTDTVRGVGTRMETVRVADGVLHVAGYLVDFQLFQELGLNFLPQLPEYDVGDSVTVGLRAAGYQVFAYPNRIWHEELMERLPPESPLHRVYADFAMDERDNVFYMHLGRGISKSAGTYQSNNRVQVTTPEMWASFVDEHILTNGLANKLTDETAAK